MVKRVCPVCGGEMFSAAVQEKWTCPFCGAEVGSLLNMGAEGKGYPVVGQIFPDGYEVLAVYMNQYVLAQNLENHMSRVVISMNQNGECIDAEFFKEAISAELCFAERCFRWYKRPGTNNRNAHIEAVIGFSLSAKTEPCFCENCKAMDAFKQFMWPSNEVQTTMRYDFDKGEILISEHGLMRIIEMANPVQLPRPVKFVMVTQDELLKKEAGPHANHDI